MYMMNILVNFVYSHALSTSTAIVHVRDPLIMSSL